MTAGLKHCMLQTVNDAFANKVHYGSRVLRR